jgi:hypothetical protein
MADKQISGEQIDSRATDARWHWMWHALDRIYGELDVDAAIEHVTVGVTTAGGKGMVYAVRKEMDGKQGVIVATDEAVHEAVQAVLKLATIAAVPSGEGVSPS